ncbi:hypothetical protein QW060_27230 [Myroides ceti]|uniref:Uncharacterized protein n=1 Tax=Paenimyroides ceti TaxID=395087 RepID=A0ABT8D525_9FLAO|nr:hypothetical protein [Paenimyroides ceti]MDN3710497.1 hypothetical protein [Paenimyroides ceti]
MIIVLILSNTMYAQTSTEQFETDQMVVLALLITVSYLILFLTRVHLIFRLIIQLLVERN